MDNSILMRIKETAEHLTRNAEKAFLNPEKAGNPTCPENSFLNPEKAGNPTRPENSFLNSEKLATSAQAERPVLLPESDVTSNTQDDLIKIHTINEGLDGKCHSVTKVPFESDRVLNSNGRIVEGTFPVFNSVDGVVVAEVRLPEEKYRATDYEQFKECNNQLKVAVENSPELKGRFSEEQLEQIENSDTPDGSTWHHHQESGRMQLVDSDVHNRTGHTGGRAIWGGGTEMRASRGGLES